MRGKRSTTLARMSHLEEHREALSAQILNHLMQGKSPDYIARSLNISSQMVNRLARESLAGEMDLIDDINYQRQLQLMKVRALSNSRFEIALDGDNVAMNQMIKLIPMENDLIGLNGKKSVQEVVLNGTITNETTVTNVSEIGERAAAVIDKYLNEDEVSEVEVENTHKPANNMKELMSKLGQSNTQFAKTKSEALKAEKAQYAMDDEIVDAEIVDDGPME